MEGQVFYCSCLDLKILNYFTATVYSAFFFLIYFGSYILILYFQMTPVERYAIRFLESSGAYITLEQIKAAKVC